MIVQVSVMALLQIYVLVGNILIPQIKHFVRLVMAIGPKMGKISVVNVVVLDIMNMNAVVKNYQIVMVIEAEIIMKVVTVYRIQMVLGLLQSYWMNAAYVMVKEFWMVPVTVMEILQTVLVSAQRFQIQII